MENLFDGKKIKNIPWIVVGLVLVAVMAAVAVIAEPISARICALLLIALVSAFIIRREMRKRRQAHAELQRLEAEKHALEMELRACRSSVLLARIQPHFLYNVLNSIHQLCETDPRRAGAMVSAFAEYLQNNLSALEEPGTVPLETELAHVRAYLDIERIRFEDTLEIEYDVQCGGFSLPVLTVQPLVENDVKHGISKKLGGGRVVISVREDGESYIITVADTGRGFAPTEQKNDGQRHVGVENVRQRLFHMCAGTLTIESEVGVGTTATIRIPKGGATST
jgi:sensor histidine kinase YesM